MQDEINVIEHSNPSCDCSLLLYGAKNKDGMDCKAGEQQWLTKKHPG